MHPGSARLKLRSDLRFVPQSGPVPWCMIEDTVRSKYYRIGWAEYSFISLLDGSLTVDEALSAAATTSPLASFTIQDGLAICTWLVESRLAEVDATTPLQRRPKRTLFTELRRSNPVSFKFPLLRPNGLFDRITPYTEWLFRIPIVLVWFLLVCVAGWFVLARWDQFCATSTQVLAPSNWIWLAVSWIPLKIVHEFAHGVACKRYGGVVREAGLFVVLLAPLAYVDVTSAWRFRSKWQRIFTATAGMYLETMVAAVAALIWCQWPTGLVGQMSFNTVMMAGVGTIVFNANPLMRFDGYYILSDWFGIPNLYSGGQQYLHFLGRRYVLGMPATLPDWPAASSLFIRCYGVAALFWRLFVCIGLVVTASTLFHGGGLLLACLAVISWLHRPLQTLGAHLVGGEVRHRRLGLLCGCLATILALLWLWVPWGFATSAPAQVCYAPLNVIRASNDGFVRDVCVVDGEQVTTGQVLLRLENEDLELELQDLELQISQAQITIRQNEREGDLAASQAEVIRCTALKQHLDELKQRVNDLVVTAPAAGRILGPYMATLVDTYVEVGRELLSIGDESQKEFQLSIAQDDVDRFIAHCQQPVAVWLPHHGSLNCILSDVQPQARRTVSEPSFAAAEGGPVAVQRIEARAGEPIYEFLEPRFTGTVPIDPGYSRDLRAGQFGIVTFAPLDETFGQHVYRMFSSWIRARRDGV